VNPTLRRTPNDYRRLFDLAVKAAAKSYGRGWELIGEDAQENAIAREILHILSIQDEELPAANLRAMVIHLHRHLIAMFNPATEESHT
jgi:hypothetical protein